MFKPSSNVVTLYNKMIDKFEMDEFADHLIQCHVTNILR